jgi:protoporphyrinogen oxidase
MFFKTYTEKVWGISCTQLSADWAAQRIKGFSLAKAIFYAFFGRWITKNKPRTICDVFYYPVYGSGFLWERIASSIKSHDHARLALNTEVVSIEHDNHMISSVWSRSAAIKTGASQLKHHGIDYLISSMPLRHFILAMDPLPPDQVVQAAQALRYRGLVTVNLIVNKVNISPDHWIYIHDKHVYVGRVGNMNNFSLKMIDDATKHTVMCLEYFSYTNEPLWAMSDHDLVALGGQELENIGLVKKSDVLDGMVVRVPEAYPVYDEGYKERLDIVLTYLAQFSNLSLIGRNGLHRYNNMDAAMLTAFEAVDKILMNEQSLTLHQQSPVQSHSSL